MTRSELQVSSRTVPHTIHDPFFELVAALENESLRKLVDDCLSQA